jgi:hypothetical protein
MSSFPVAHGLIVLMVVVIVAVKEARSHTGRDYCKGKK